LPVRERRCPVPDGRPDSCARPPTRQPSETPVDETLARGDHATDGMAAREKDSTTINFSRRRIGRVEMAAGRKDKLPSAGWAGRQIIGLGYLGMALQAKLGHKQKITPRPPR
jgi:hypothetical protein